MTIMPKASRLGALSPGQRQKMLAEARRKRDEQRDSGLHTGLRRSLLQATANAMAMKVAEEKLRTQIEQGEGRLPVRLGDLRGPGGNVFWIVASLRESIRYAEQRGLAVTPMQREVVENFMHRTYEETLDLIVQHFDDLDGSVALYRLRMYGDPVAPDRHKNDDATFATP